MDFSKYQDPKGAEAMYEGLKGEIGPLVVEKLGTPLTEAQVKAFIAADKAQKSDPEPVPTPKLSGFDVFQAKMYDSALRRGLLSADDIGKRTHDTVKKNLDIYKAAADITSATAGLELVPVNYMQDLIAPAIASCPFLAKTTRIGGLTTNILKIPTEDDSGQTGIANVKSGSSATQMTDIGVGTTGALTVQLVRLSRSIVLPRDILRYAVVDYQAWKVQRLLRYIALDIEGYDLEGTTVAGVTWNSVLSRATTNVTSATNDIYKSFVKALKLIKPEYRGNNFGLTMHDDVHTSLILARDLEQQPIFPLGQFGNAFGGQNVSVVGMPCYLSAKPATTGNKSNVYVGDPANFVQFYGNDFEVLVDPYTKMDYDAVVVHVQIVTAGCLIDGLSMGVSKDWATV
jgi:HK97 family phage major capsid protein